MILKNFQQLSRLLLGLLILSFSIPAQANVAKVIMLRGKAFQKPPGGAEERLEKGQWVVEGSEVRTEAKSFVKFLFIDKSQMNLGPKSKMTISKFPKNKPGLIKLINGQLRAKVTKDPLQAGKNKLFIKTKTAAMGVRGTDFTAIFNDQNSQSSVITYEGEVAMVKDTNPSVDFGRLNAVVNSPAASTSRMGQFVGVNPKQARASIGQKLNAAQFNALRANVNFEAGGAKTANSKFQSPIPPNVSSRTFANDAKNVDKVIASEIGGSVANEVVAEATSAADEIKAAGAADAPPEGVFNKATGEFAPPAGSMIDLATGLSVPPPPGAAFDANTGQFQMPPDMAGIDAGGNFTMRDGVELQPNGEIAIAEGANLSTEAARALANDLSVNLGGDGPMIESGITDPEALSTGDAQDLFREVLNAERADGTGDPLAALPPELLPPEGADDIDGEEFVFEGPPPPINQGTTTNVLIKVIVQ